MKSNASDRDAEASVGHAGERRRCGLSHQVKGTLSDLERDDSQSWNERT
jgi:hypothetical protein